MPSALGFVFDATQVEPQRALDPMPAGWYNATITASENKQAKSNPNHGYVELGIKIADGQHAGRMVFDRLNLWNTNQTTVEIAQKTLSAICHATNVFRIQDVQQLHGIPIMIRLIVKPAEGEYEARNEVRGYDKPGTHNIASVASGPVMNGGAPGAPPAGAPPAPPAAAPGGAPSFQPPFAPAPAPPAGAPPGPPAGAPPVDAPPPAPAAPPAAPPADAPPPAPVPTPVPTPVPAGAPAGADNTPPWLRAPGT